MALGRAPSPDRVDEAVAWWEGVHLPDLAAVPGVLAAVRLTRADDEGGDEAPPGAAAAPPSAGPAVRVAESGLAEQTGLVLHLLLCEDDPAVVIGRVARARRSWQAVGRFPAHRGAYEELAFLPYRLILPLQYDFDMSPDDAGAGPVTGVDGGPAGGAVS